MTGQVNTQNVQMTFTPPKVGVVEPPKSRTSGVLSKDTIEIANAKTPQDIKNAGIKKKKSPINIINYMWLGVATIVGAVAGSDFIKLIKKH